MKKLTLEQAKTMMEKNGGYLDLEARGSRSRNAEQYKGMRAAVYVGKPIEWRGAREVE